MKPDSYSPTKFASFPEHIQAIQSGTPAPPIHVQLILSDLCNEDCSFCCVKGTLIATPRGNMRIEEIKDGDLVYGPDGEPAKVEVYASRIVGEVLEITCAGRTVMVTHEHPILTANGWKKARDLTERDWAVVRVRLRQPGQESSGVLESVPRESSAPTGSESGGKGQSCREHAAQQSHEEAGGSRTLRYASEREAYAALSRGEEEHSGCCQEADAIGSEPQ